MAWDAVSTPRRGSTCTISNRLSMKILHAAALLAALFLLGGLPCTSVELKGRLVDSLTWTGQRHEPGTEVPFR